MHPTPRMVVLLLSGLPVALLPTLVAADLWPVWVVYLAFLALATAAETLWLPAPQRVQLESAPPQRIYIGEQGEWHLRISAPGVHHRMAFELSSDLDPDLEPQPTQSVVVDPNDAIQVRIRLCPKRRGTLTIEAIWLRWRGRFGLLARTHRVPIDASIEVVPDTGAVRATALRFFSSPSAFAGLKTERYVGDGSEFESLRQYVPGLDVRSIDWKASARHRRLLCRRFRAERNHQVILAVDTGHLMGEALAGVPRLDHAINQALLLGYFCLRSGDRVGLYGFDARPGSFAEPQSGMRSFSRLQSQSAGLQYGQSETNFTLGVIELSRRLRRRSLVVVFSEFVDTITAELMLENLDRLARRHLVVFVALRDPSLEAIERAELRQLADLNRAVVAAELGRDRDVVLERLQRTGIHVVDALPGDISVRLLNRYFEIKRRELV